MIPPPPPSILSDICADQSSPLQSQYLGEDSCDDAPAIAIDPTSVETLPHTPRRLLPNLPPLFEGVERRSGAFSEQREKLLPLPIDNQYSDIDTDTTVELPRRHLRKADTVGSVESVESLSEEESSEDLKRMIKKNKKRAYKWASFCLLPFAVFSLLKRALEALL